MITRTAYLEGDVAPEDQPAFDAYMAGTVVEEISRYPGIRRVTVRKCISADEGATPNYMQFDLYFDSLQAMEAALASDIRQAVQARIKAGMGPFRGRVIHVVSEQIADRAHEQ